MKDKIDNRQTSNGRKEGSKEGREGGTGEGLALGNTETDQMSENVCVGRYTLTGC